MVAIGSSLAQLAGVPGDPVAALLARYGDTPHALVQILHEAQLQQGWLPRAMLGERESATLPKTPIDLFR
jgi:[NiFe] hydrogenase diaphorase moiety large subunit